VGDAEGSQIRESAPLEAACSLLHLDPTALKDALASRTLETMAPGGKTETYEVPLNPTQASLARDALVKSIYSKLFDELVEQARARRLYERGRGDGVVTIARRSTSPSTRASRMKMTRSC
jgi:myosin heavy subunit